MIKDKNAIEMSFNWIFSIIVGAVFIFLAIYASRNLINSERTTIDTESAQQLEFLLNPLETSIEVSAKPREIIFPSESRVLIGCDEKTSSSILRVQASSSIGGKWQDAGIENNVYSKYIFALKVNQGKKFGSMIFPLNLPYKVGQITIFWSDKKCLINAPPDVKETFGNTTYNIFMAQNSAQCPSGSQKICFSEDSSCDINIDFLNKRIKKQGKNLFFEGNLIYAAMFSDSEIYECNLLRLNKKRSYLANLFSKKSLLIETSSQSGCSRALQGSLVSYASLPYNSSRNLALIYQEASKLEKENDPLLCKLWKEELS